MTASLDKNLQLCHWNMQGEALYIWHGDFRILDCAITVDGKRVVAADNFSKVHVYNLHTHEEEYCLSLPYNANSVSVSRDSRYMLVNISGGEIEMIDIETTDVIRHFKGQKQSNCVIRSIFGGAAETFVLSGSEGKN